MKNIQTGKEIRTELLRTAQGFDRNKLEELETKKWIDYNWFRNELGLSSKGKGNNKNLLQLLDENRKEE